MTDHAAMAKKYLDQADALAEVSLETAYRLATLALAHTAVADMTLDVVAEPNMADRIRSPRAKLSAAKPDHVLVQEWRKRWPVNPGRPTITATYRVGNDRAYRLMKQAWPKDPAIDYRQVATEVARLLLVNGTSH